VLSPGKHRYEIIRYSVLYRKLSCTDTTKLESAVQLFGEDQTDRVKQTIQVRVGNCQITSNFLPALPQAFPRMKHLIWRDYYKEMDEVDRNFDIHMEGDYASKYKYWKDGIQNIKLIARQNPISPFFKILFCLNTEELFGFKNLTRLCVTLRGDPNIRPQLSRRSLLGNICSTNTVPSLIYLNLKNIAINLMDIEKLSTSLAQLQLC
jgi:hypothetical protein